MEVKQKKIIKFSSCIHILSPYYLSCSFTKDSGQRQCLKFFCENLDIKLKHLKFNLSAPNSNQLLAYVKRLFVPKGKCFHQVVLKKPRTQAYFNILKKCITKTKIKKILYPPKFPEGNYSSV